MTFAQIDRYNCNTYIPPTNDICNDAIPFTGILDGVTCCGEIEQIDLCGDMETGVWYVYNQSLEGTQFNFRNVDIEGPIGVEIYSGNCDNLKLETRSDCSGFSDRVFQVANCNSQVFIHISTKDEGCGAFQITATDIPGCGAAENCTDIGPEHTILPDTDQGETCIPSCLNFSCNSSCGDQSVWFLVNTDALATELQFTIDNAEFDPLISVTRFGSSCADGDQIFVCQPIENGIPLPMDAAQDVRYLVEISSAGGEASVFDLCVSAINEPIDCAEAFLTASRPEYPFANPNGPYCPGETVEFCYDLVFNVDFEGEGNNCQWLQGIVPVLGGGWDLNMRDLSSDVPSGWIYYPEGTVDYNVNHPTIAATTDPLGRIALEHGPGGLSPGDLLPGGWWFVTSGADPGCIPDGDPDNMWGLDAPCGGSSIIQHCFSLTAKAPTAIADCNDSFSKDLSISIFVFADGETGCYANSACTGDTPATFNGEIDCSTLYDVDVADAEICSKGFANIPVGVVGGYEIPIQVRVVSEGNTTGAQDWVFESGSGIVPDQIVNNGNDIELVTYAASLYNPDSDCPVNEVLFDVRVHPHIEVDVPTRLICEGTAQTFTASGNYASYRWYDLDNNEISNTTSADIANAGVYILQVEDGICFEEFEVVIESVSNLPYALIQDEVNVCNNDIGTLPVNIDLNDFLVASASGNWTDNFGFRVNEVDFTGMSAGPQVFTFMTDNAEVPCLDTTYTFTVNVEACSCPEIDLVPLQNICVPDDGSVIISELLYEPNTDPNGEWSQTAGPSTLGIDLASNTFSSSNATIPGVYEFTYTLNDPNVGPICTTSASIEVEIGIQAFAEIVPNGTACNAMGGAEPFSLDLDDFFVSGSTGDWNGNGISIDADNRVSFDGEAPGDYEFVYSTNTGSGLCGNSDYILTITVQDCACEPLEFLPLQNVCQEDQEILLTDLIVDAGPGTWTVSSTSTTVPEIKDNSRLVILPDTESGVYTLTYTLSNTSLPANCDTEFSMDFSVVQAPAVELIAQSSVCNQDIGTDPDFINLNDLFVSGSSGLWSTDEGLTIGGDNVVSFTGAEVRDYVFTYTTNDAQAPCQDISVDVIVTVKDCSCPSLVVSQMTNLCQDDLQFNLDDLIVDAGPGSWSIVAGLGNAPTIDNNMLNVGSNSDAGIYELTYTLDDPNVPSSCDNSISLSFEIIEPPFADVLTEVNVCNESTGGLATAVDLDTLVRSGSTGDWSFDGNVLSVDAENVMSFETLNPGDYQLTYTTNDAVSPCADVEYSVTVSVNDCSCPSANIDIPDLCQEDNSYDLNNYFIDGATGQWIAVNFDPSFVSPVFFDQLTQTIELNSNTTAGLYTAVYQFTDSNIPPTCAQEIEVDFNIIGSPSADVVSSVVVCNALNSSLSAMLDLDTLVRSGSSGDWAIDAALNADADNVINFENLPVDTYVLTYTTNDAVAPCQNVEYQVSVSVVDCSCPIIALELASPLCNEQDLLDLNSLKVNGVGDGVWSFVDGPEAVTLNLSEFDASGLSGGVYTFEFMLNGNIPAGCDDSAQVTVEVNETPQLTVEPSFEVCNQTSSLAPLCVDLSSFSSTQEGAWERPANFVNDFSDITNICFEGAQVGETFEFIFTTNNAVNPCGDVSGSIVITVIDCNCPNLSLINPDPICNQDGILDLSDLETPETVSGSWSFVDGPEQVTLIANREFDATMVGVGIYTFQFTPNVTPDAGCDQFTTIDVQVFEPLSAGVGNVIDYCEGEDQIIDLFALLDNAEPGGMWTEVSANRSEFGFDEDNGVFSMIQEAAGIYEFEYSHFASVSCPTTVATVLVVINGNPIADAGEDFELNCIENTYALGGPNMSSGARIEYLWEEESGIVIPNNTTANPIITQPGIYNVTVSDNLFGCQSIDQVIISEETSIPTFDAEVLPIACDGSALGGIVISNSTGGNGDYRYSLDGGATWTDNTLFDNLDAGIYDVLIQDGNGCESSVNGLEIFEPIFIGLDLGEDKEVQFGDFTITLNLTTIASPEDIQIVVWEENGEVICDGTHEDCVEVEVDPQGSSTYCVTVTDQNGCEESECIVITEVVDPNIYMANIFTPDKISFNNRYFVQSDEYIVAVKEFMILDRWGNVVFVAEENHLPNNPAFGWDGTFNGEPAPSGVYTYFAKAEDIVGDIRIVKGDVTLMR